jgi:hypothetical protein
MYFGIKGASYVTGRLIFPQLHKNTPQEKLKDSLREERAEDEVGLRLAEEPLMSSSMNSVILNFSGSLAKVERLLIE